MTTNLTPREKITVARVALQKKSPFFSYLVMSLEINEDAEGKITETCAVDSLGNLFYNPKWINKLTNQEIITVLTHEVLHVAFLHFLRTGKRDRFIFNIASDIIVNNLLQLNGFTFSSELNKGYVPSGDAILVKGTTLVIKELSTRTSEEVYHLIFDHLKKNSKSGKEGEQGQGFDKHIYSDGEGKEMPKQEQEKIERTWKNKVTEAINHAKMQGNMPAGIDRSINKLLDVKLNWKQLLYKYVSDNIPFDFSYSRPNKRFYSTGIYTPRTIKECLDVTVAIDTSGSIGGEEISEFISELIGIGTCFENVNINLLFWDTQCNNHYILGKTDIGDVTKLKVGGGGGTDFRGVYEYMQEHNLANSRLLIFFTDAYAIFPAREEYKTLWVVTEKGENLNRIPFGDKIKLE